MGKKVLICGGRDFDYEAIVYEILESLCIEDDPWTTVIVGGAKGADKHGEAWARSNELSVDLYPAEWEKYGKGAGYIRNKQMLDADPDLVIAFPGGKGTAMMVDLAEKAGVEVINYND